eukprot:2004548-Pyramimonas_sp.AAC.1
MGGASAKEYDDQRTLTRCRTMSNEQARSILAIPAAENALCYRRLAWMQKIAQRPQDNVALPAALTG